MPPHLTLFHVFPISMGEWTANSVWENDALVEIREHASRAAFDVSYWRIHHRAFKQVNPQSQCLSL
jgi:hypothetical protein